jgi:integrase
MSTVALNRQRYQQGTIERVARANGPDVWVYRWREESPTGKRVQRKRVIGTLEKIKTLSAARAASDDLRLAANSSGSPVGVAVEPLTFGQVYGHFYKKELFSAQADRSPTTIQVYKENFKRHILPKWKRIPIADITPVMVEAWFESLKSLAPGTKAKFRNQMSCVFSHAIRHSLFVPRSGANPISSVRQSSKRQSLPDVLNLDEIGAIIQNVTPPAIKLMVIVAATTALRRSEVRGLKWSDLDLSLCWIYLARGVVRKWTTKMKTEASRKGIPMMPELAVALEKWRLETLYNQDSDWVFASPYTEGKRPYYGESAMENHILPAARKAGITKQVGWHTFRHSYATLLARKNEPIKVAQELLRHSSSRLTLDLYQQGEESAKRQALTHSASLFALTA